MDPSPRIASLSGAYNLFRGHLRRGVKGTTSVTDDPELEEAKADLSEAGWSIDTTGYSTAGVTLTFRRDATPEQREIVERQTFGKTQTEAILAFLKELDDEQGAGGS